jgi:tRNA-splicing ligase RtcB
MSLENHFGQDVILTRKGAVDASLNKMVIIPGSMGARTYIARGLGNEDSFHSCSHGAGRAMGRRAAERTISLADHQSSLAGIECHSGSETIDESPAAYKPIDAVMAAQIDLVEKVHELRQIVNVKGWEK